MNAYKHSGARCITIRGYILPDVVELEIQDDGKGFNMGPEIDISGLLTNKQYGLAGMYERAELINAQINLESIPERGTTVSLLWRR